MTLVFGHFIGNATMHTLLGRDKGAAEAPAFGRRRIVACGDGEVVDAKATAIDSVVNAHHNRTWLLIG